MMNVTHQKRRWQRGDALAVAADICAELQWPVTARLGIVGSVRRGKEWVGDLELLFVPVLESRKFDLLDEHLVDLAEERIDNMLARGLLAKRPSKIGTFAWGVKNKLAVHVPSGMPVDLFTATEQNWWNMLVCRTGPADSNTEICARAQRIGYKWNPYGAGFTSRTGEEVAMHSEREVFEFVGLEFRKPEER